jgi:polyhydroxybutyrate depolymerase
VRRLIIAPKRNWLVVLVAVVACALAAEVTGSSGATQTSSVANGVLPPIVHRPANLSSATPVPLLLGLHGKGGTPTLMESTTGLDSIADQNGFVVAYLDYAPPVIYDAPNIAYISSMIDQLTASENIDPRRVYVFGFSLGGYDTFRSGCDLSSKVAAIAIVSSTIAPLSRQSCKISRPVSELNVAGTQDQFPINQTPASPISADQTATIWRGLNGCSSQAQKSQVGPTSQTLWTDCNDGSAVGEYVINGGVHTWPGAPGAVGADAQYNASQAIWDFVSQHQASLVTTPGAKLLSLRVAASPRREVRAVVGVTASFVQAQMTLTAPRHVVTSKSVKLSRGQANSLVLPVPRQAVAGRGVVKLVFADQYGRRSTVVRNVTVPKLLKS